MHDENGTFEVDPNIPTSQHPVLQALNERIAKLEQDLDMKQSRCEYLSSLNSATSNKYEMLQEKLKAVLTRLYQENDLSKDTAETIADECDLEITYSVLVSGTINWSGRVDVSIFTDLDDARYEVDVDCLDITAFGETIQYLDHDLEDVNAEIS